MAGSLIGGGGGMPHGLTFPARRVTSGKQYPIVWRALEQNSALVILFGVNALHCAYIKTPKFQPVEPQALAGLPRPL